MNKATAFTLVELLVVIAIVGILSGLIIVGMSSSVKSANIAKAQIFSNSLRDSLMMSLVGEWKFDEGSGTTAHDTWKNLSDGILTNFADTTAGYGDANTSGWMTSSKNESWHTTLSSNAALLADNWYHVAGSYESTTNTVKIYVNGVLSVTDTTSTTGPILTNANAVTFGYFSSGFPHRFGGDNGSDQDL